MQRKWENQAQKTKDKRWEIKSIDRSCINNEHQMIKFILLVQHSPYSFIHSIMLVHFLSWEFSSLNLYIEFCMNSIGRKKFYHRVVVCLLHLSTPQDCKTKLNCIQSIKNLSSISLVFSTSLHFLFESNWVKDYLWKFFIHF